MPVLENTFSWSRSRAATYERCPRSYWWQYYGSWGGWDRDAPAEAREAYTLKNLSNRWAWAGTIVHGAIERILRGIQDRALSGRLPFEPAAVRTSAEIDALTERMRLQYRESRGGAYRESPKRRFGLMEHEYEDPVSADDWRAVHRKACDALRGFLESEVFQRIRSSDPATWFPIESLDQFDFEGVGVWAVPDFARRDGEGGTEIYDWKTGAVKPGHDRLQLACYTLYMQEKHGRDPSRTVNHLVYLGPEVRVFDFVLSEEDLEGARETMRSSIRAMRDRLADPTTNRAEREEFPLVADRELCTSCVYRRLCGR